MSEGRIIRRRLRGPGAGLSARLRRRGASVRGNVRARSRAGAVLSLNLTPMIDTVFNLLFFFMIISRFGPVEGMLPAPLPAREGTAPSTTLEIPRTPLRVQLAADAQRPESCQATIAPLSESPVAVTELAAELTRIRQGSPGFDEDTPVYLAAGDSVMWNHVVNAYNAALAAGYRKIFFAGPP